MAISSFKIKKEVKDLEELIEILKKHLDPKFEYKIDRAGSGFKKFLTGTNTDVLEIKKNAYHGVVLTLSEIIPEMDYQVIGAQMIVPNYFLDQIVGHDGILDTAICHLIFGNGKDLYDKLQEAIAEELDGVGVEDSFLNNMKAFFQGKTVYDDI